jgi:hypothetical protein
MLFVRQEHNKLTQNVLPSHCDRSQEPSKERPSLQHGGSLAESEIQYVASGRSLEKSI